MSRRTVDLAGAEWAFGCVAPQPLDVRADDHTEVGEWLPANVPGNVRSDLLALGRIEDPFVGTNNEASQWVDECDWWYVRPLEVDLADGERAFLCFEGLDYISSVHLSGKELGRHEGMFSRQTYEITDLLEPGVARLAVRFWGSGSLPRRQLAWWERVWSPVATALQKGNEAFPDRSATLKCQMGFGWDFAPRIRTIGVWDDVTLLLTRSVFVSDLFIQARPEKDGARVFLQSSVDSDRAQVVTAEVEIKPRGGPSSHTWRWELPLSLEAGRQISRAELTLPEAHLWHPWDRGEPQLHDLRLRIVGEGQVLDSVSESFGIRSVEMVENPGTPKGNEDWTLVINGEREFVRGLNWVPLDALPGRLRRSHYEPFITMAREGGVNLLRVWGGGLREKRVFYDLCDELGILVWQEFPLACLMLGHFPRSRRFRDLLVREGTGIVRGLRNHPSVAIWCGGNEFSSRRNRSVVTTLQGIVRAEDGTRPFRATSPGQGDGHNWLVWHGKAPVSAYREDGSQFVSEFGLQSVPHVSSLRRFLSDQDLFPPGEGWSYHSAQLEKLRRYVRPLAPSTLQEWVDASQRVQCYGLQTAIEHFRRRKYLTSGTVVWQFNDPWPAISWSLVDYYGKPKLAWEKLRSLYNPILVSLEYPSRRYQAGDLLRARVWVINDQQRPLPDCLLEVQLDGREVLSVRVSLPSDSCEPVGRVEVTLREAPRLLTAVLRDGEQLLSSNEYDLTYYDSRGTNPLDTLHWRVGRWLLE